jgi:alpha-1,3-mannosyltransferase
MRVLHVVRQFAPGVGGLENYVAELARTQSETGHEPTILTLDRLFGDPGRQLPASERVGHCDVKRIPYFGSYKYPIAPGVFRHLREYDLIHVHGIDYFFDALAWTRPWHGRPLVVSTHGGFFHTRFAARLKKVFFHTVTRTSLRAYSAILASSANDRDLFSRLTGRYIELVENGVDTNKFASCASPVFCKRLVSIGRFASHKRLDLLLDFLAEIRRHDTEWSLALLGVEWDVKVKELTERVAARGLANAVSIRSDLPNADIAHEIRKASFIVSASDYEGFGIAIIEGMSAGLIPAMSGIPPFRRLQERSGTGLVLDFSDSRVAAKRFIDHARAVASNYGQEQQQARGAAEQFAWPIVAGKIDAIYKRVVGEHRRNILGVPVLVATRAKAVETLDAEVDAGHSTRVSFLNAHSANIACVNKKFSRVLRNSLVLNDGIGVDIASAWIYGRRFPENLNGTDFTIEYLKQTHRTYNIYLLGARRRIVTQAAIRLAAKFRRHRIVGYYDGYFDPLETPRIIENIRRSGADLLLVGFGNPAQELWIAENLEKTGCRLGFGVGALFDFTSGAMPRAPEWVRQCHAEWLYRLSMEPGRLWRRYLVGNATFLYRLLNQGTNGVPAIRTGER